MDLATAVGYCAALLVFLTFATKTMVPLRVLGIASNVFFIAYGYLQPALPILLLHSLLLPLNTLRLHQMLRLIRQVSEASRSDLNMDWLQQFCTSRHIAAGEILFRKGAPADRMAFLLSGRLRIAALNIDLGPGEVVGELGLTAPDHVRTQTVECIEPGDVLEITYDRVRQLYFQNPTFGFFFLDLTTRRLFQNIASLEAELARAAPERSASERTASGRPVRRASTGKDIEG